MVSSVISYTVTLITLMVVVNFSPPRPWASFMFIFICHCIILALNKDSE